MATATQWDRRALLTLAARTRVCIERCNPAAVEPRRRAELVVARRSMACEFSVTFPAGTRNGVDAGCAALDEVERIEEKLSVYREESDLSYLNRTASTSPVHLDAELYGFLRLARQLSGATGGAFDITAGALVDAWGFRGGPRRVPSEAQRLAALARCGWSRVRFDDGERTVSFACQGLVLNPGAIGKGYAIDAALARVRRKFGIASALMQGGQSSLVGLGWPRGESRGWPVAIGDPRCPDRLLARVFLRNRALGTSATSNQFFLHEGRHYGHILDPRTGHTACGVESASAIAPTGAEADALSTAFFVMGLEGTRRFCREHPEVGAILAAREIHVIGTADAEVMV